MTIVSQLIHTDRNSCCVRAFSGVDLKSLKEKQKLFWANKSATVRYSITEVEVQLNSNKPLSVSLKNSSHCLIANSKKPRIILTSPACRLFLPFQNHFCYCGIILQNVLQSDNPHFCREIPETFNLKLDISFGFCNRMSLIETFSGPSSERLSNLRWSDFWLFLFCKSTRFSDQLDPCYHTSGKLSAFLLPYSLTSSHSSGESPSINMHLPNKTHNLIGIIFERSPRLENF